MVPKLEAVYSVKEVSVFLGVSDDTVRRLIRRGELKALKLPRLKNGKRPYEVFRIFGTDVLDFIAGNMNGRG